MLELWQGMGKKLLLVDDKKPLAEVLRCYLENHGFSVTCAENGAEALMLARENPPDLVVTDAEMPGMDGFALCRELKALRASPALPVILISGVRTADEDIVSGYGEGADDYLTKPFSFPVLAAKIRAVLRRYAACPAAAEERVALLGMVLDPSARTVSVGGRPAALTRKEFDLLALLLQNVGRVLSVPYILETVWGYDVADYNDPHTVEVHIYSLRKKLGPALAAHIISVMGHGYKFE